MLPSFKEFLIETHGDRKIKWATEAEWNKLIDGTPVKERFGSKKELERRLDRTHDASTYDVVWWDGGEAEDLPVYTDKKSGKILGYVGPGGEAFLF